MDLHAWLAVGVIVGCVGLLATSLVPAELVLFAALGVLLVTGLLTPTEALAGFANEGLMTVALMYLVAAAIRETGGMALLVRHLLGSPRGVVRAQWRLMLPVAAMSAFMNNTPLVATFMPATLDWARRLAVSPSRLLLPLSYAAILGGTCTLIGTSTNLVVNGLMLQSGMAGLGLFDLAWVGLPVAVTGIGYVLLAGRRWLPERIPATTAFDNPREYTVEMKVDPGPLVGRTVEQAGLRSLQGLFLVEIERDGGLIPAVGHHERLRAGDRLVFAGMPDSVVELQRVKGLSPVGEGAYNLGKNAPERLLVEAVVAPSCAVVGRTLRQSRFRSRYGATVVAVARRGRRVRGRLGDIRLRPSDTLLLETRPSFVERHRNHRDFLLISPVPDSRPVRHERAWLAWLILIGVVGVAATGTLSMLKAATVGAMLMLVTGCLSVTAARRSLDFPVLLAIASAFALGRALETTGAAQVIAQGVLGLAGDNPWLVLIAAYLLTSIMTEILTNNAVAVLMFPILTAAAQGLGVDPLPFMVALMMGASANFATPIGYQTNLMVYGPGGYRFGDYLRLGIPLNLLVGAVAVAIIPLVWPF